MPKELRSQAVAMAHEGHLGAVKMKERMRAKMWFPEMDAMAEKEVKNCKECLMTSLPNRPLPVKRRLLPDYPMEAIGMDYKVVGKVMVLVLIDYYSRLVIYEIVEPATAKQTALTLRRIFSLFGVPSIIQCDNGTHFLGEVEMLSQEFGIKLNHSAPHFPQANGEVERVNREFKVRLQQASANGQDWRPAIADYVLGYHASPHPALGGKTPAQAFFNRRIKDKLPDIRKQPHPEDESIRDADRLYKEKGRVRTDLKRKAKMTDLDVGDLVMSQNFERGALIPNFGPEEYVITEMNEAEAQIESTENPEKRLRRHLVHLKKLPNTDQMQGQQREAEATTQTQEGEGQECITIEDHSQEREGTAMEVPTSLSRRERRLPSRFKDYQLTDVRSAEKI